MEFCIINMVFCWLTAILMIFYGDLTLMAVFSFAGWVFYRMTVEAAAAEKQYDAARDDR